MDANVAKFPSTAQSPYYGPGQEKRKVLGVSVPRVGLPQSKFQIQDASLKWPKRAPESSRNKSLKSRNNRFNRNGLLATGQL